MPKNIVILLDGTSNEISADRTNVLRLYGTLEKSDSQLVYYDPGVGTFGAENSWSRWWRKAVEIWGLATGWGLDHNVKEAYRFLVENYDDGKRGRRKQVERDSIYIFGFSRGAYSARVLAGFIHAVGLIEPRNLNLLDYAYRAYKQIGEGQEKRADEDDDAGNRERSRSGPFAEVRLYERILAPDRPPIRLLGLFDTVASIIESGRSWPRLRSHAFTSRNRSVESVRHALAIEERRTMFRQTPWPEDQEYWGNPFNRSAARPQDAREVWFAGVHGDVGGGYPEVGSGLAKVPLVWMIEQTRPMGLRYRKQTVNEIVLGTNPAKHYVAPNPLADRHESMNWAWSILEYLPQWRRADPKAGRPGGFTVPYFRYRTIPPGARIHESVVKRIDAGLVPPNLPPSYEVEPM